MRSTTYFALFASTAVAQESATILNLFQFQNTLTVVNSDASATTFQNNCPSDAAGISAVPSELRPTAPSPTPAPRLRRQDQSSSDIDNYSFCEPYTLIQGASKYEFHLTDPTPGAWTLDMACNWQGGMTAADLTCTVTQSGYVPDASVVGVTTSVLKQTEIREMEAYQTIAVVRASGGSQSGAPSASASRTASGSGTGAASPTRSGSTSASAAVASQSTGLAPAGPLPTGAMMFIGSAAGVFAAALAL
ncbi:hypothetical protein BKA66DRAFT_428747 [Pyrenochaeta sp. MPI-SDFR-AT-0127]|nr:hypothetical protein BKA66DRAFT_428747 [Pyrenochaeta sp. MPI-SDFR-AT-0127]